MMNIQFIYSSKNDFTNESLNPGGLCISVQWNENVFNIFMFNVIYIPWLHSVVKHYSIHFAEIV